MMGPPEECKQSEYDALRELSILLGNGVGNTTSSHLAELS